MPTYEYRCDACGLTFERHQSMTEDPVKTCPECSGKVHRIVSGGLGFIMKGSGHGEVDRPGGGCSLATRSGPLGPGDWAGLLIFALPVLVLGALRRRGPSRARSG